MHPATEVQAQLHRPGAVIAEPVRGGGREVEGDDITVADSAGDAGLGRQLLVLVTQADQGVATAGINRRVEVLDAGLVQRRQGAAQGLLVDLLGAALPGDLQRGVGRVQVGRGIEQAQRDKKQDQQVFPQGVLIQHIGALRGDAAASPLKSASL